MRVEIMCIEPGCEILTYTVDSEAECRDEVDLFAYRHVAESGLDCRVGCVLAVPVAEEATYAAVVETVSEAAAIALQVPVRYLRQTTEIKS